jgi:hypothetical protein
MLRLAQLVACLGIMAAAPLAAQDPGGAPARAAIEKLAWLEGEWRGEGWMQTGPGAPKTVSQREKVFRAAGGTILVVQGLAMSTEAGAPASTLVHDAFGVVSYDMQRRQYTLRTHVANGNSIEVVPEVGDKRFVWGFDHPQGGRMRYTLLLESDGAWHEIGERSTDAGATWVKFLEFRVRK